MKITLLLILMGVMGVQANSFSQKTRIDVQLKRGNMIQLFDLIQKKSDYRVIYNDDILAELKQTAVDLNLQQVEVPTLLNKAFRKSPFTYRLIGNQIAVFEERAGGKDVTQPAKNELLPEVVDKLSGIVKDSKGQVLPGATVIVRGTEKGTSTSTSGEFKIEADPGDVIVVSYIGFRTQELTVGNQTRLEFVLEEDLAGLEEVVIVGFGTQRKATVTGSIATITTADLEQSPTASITNSLAGRLPGLLANQFSGGEPGVDRSDLFIRGMATYGNTAPIVIIDGLERSMDYLSPAEIETFSILKDASATAPYGVRGANGVILITTKRGKVQDKATVNFKAAYGINQPVQFPKYLGSADYAMLYNEARLNDSNGADPSTLNLFSEEAIANFRKAKGDNSDGLGYDWDYFDYAFKNGKQSDYNLSISGGSQRARYFVLANYFQQDGNYKHDNLNGAYSTQAVFKRYNFRSNIDIDITDNFYAKLDIGARITDRNAPGTTASKLVEIANTQPSYLPIVLENNGNEANATFVANNPLGMLYGDQIYRLNILGELSRTGYLNERNTYLNGSFSLGHKLNFITEGLSIDGVFSYDSQEGRWIQRNVPTYAEGYKEYPGYATFVPTEGSDVYRTPGHYLGAYKSGNKYQIDQTIGNGFSFNDNNNRAYVQVKLDYMRNFAKHQVTGMVLVNRSNRVINNQVPFRYQGITGRATYGFDDRYLFEFNAAYNGSENFAKGTRYGFFPSASAGWVVSKEKFLEGSSNWLNNLKIRASYGLVGSDRLPNDKRFLYLQYFVGGSNYNFGTDNFGSSAGGGLQEGDLSNPKLTWEKAKKTNIGIDMTLFRQLSLTLDLFQENRYDIITDLGGGDKLGYSDIVGKNAPYVNSGRVENKGFDMELGWNGSIGKNFTYYVRPNFTFARNKILFMNEIAYDYAGRANTGRRIGEHFNYVFDHFVANAEEAKQLNEMNNGAGFQPWGQLIPGDVVYKDMNGDGRIDDLGDRTATGNPSNPEIMFGLPVGAKYKAFDFSLLFQGAASGSMQLNGAAAYDFPLFSQDKYGKVKPMHLNRWTPETAATATYPALHFGVNNNNKNNNSSLFLYDRNYVRLKTVEIGFSLPKPMLERLKISKLRLYAQGMNLLTWDSLSKVGMDPETREGSGDWYPVQRVFNFGLDLSF
ncbi:SusC/RagA family TonB-linked outer membrane protein [Dyadobacter jejuensis]|nr:TonB-dependent receptor [Dyadobacter jejuensis]